MNYKVSCPSCGLRATRWQIFGSPTIYHRCRGCGASFGLTAAGWCSMFGVIALQIGWFVLAQFQVVSRYTAIALLLATCGLAIWLLPYFSPVKLRKMGSKSVGQRRAQIAAPSRRLLFGPVPWSFGILKSQGSAVGELVRRQRAP